MKSWKIGRNVGRSEIWLSRGAAWYGWGGGGFLSEAGLRERAQAQRRVFGAGGREFEFVLFGFGTLVLLGSIESFLTENLRIG